MSSHTLKRILSAFVLILIVSMTFFSYQEYTLFLVVLIGFLVNDEIYINFFNYKRLSLGYISVQFIYLFIFYVSLGNLFIERYINYFGVAMNLGLLLYLFKGTENKNIFIKIKEKWPVCVFVLALTPMISLSYLVSFDKWRQLILLLLIVNFGMDSGAWFFGKMLGKRKLWPEVSPNKTVEGLLGGMITAGFLGYCSYFILFSKNAPWVIIIFSFLGFLSQVGDLVQSKLKRQFGIKDSSSLIPGHGGVYDRIDSLVFVLPFFMLTIYYYY